MKVASGKAIVLAITISQMIPGMNTHCDTPSAVKERYRFAMHATILNLGMHTVWLRY